MCYISVLRVAVNEDGEVDDEGAKRENRERGKSFI